MSSTTPLFLRRALSAASSLSNCLTSSSDSGCTAARQAAKQRKLVWLRWRIRRGLPWPAAP
eukprot:5135207-Prorocentrum_lima.AAC.1